MQTRTRVKFCGITRPEDALLAVSLGVDALGFVFYDKSPRCISPVDASRIVAQLPPFVCKVGLFVNPRADDVVAVSREAQIDLLQFHGDEEPGFCASFERPYVKAVRMADGVDLSHEARRYATAVALLLDAFEKDRYGGTGGAFDWSRVATPHPKPIILAGGLHPANVASAIAAVGPYAVDVSSGIERDKGMKDPAKMKQFMQEVRIVER